KEVAVIRSALELGIELIDTAEMYGEGGSEEVIGQAIRGYRDQVFLVSKVYPHNASHRGVMEACERSLNRLQSDYIDLYLLHWPGHFPLQQTFDGFEELKQSGKIRDFGVSNFDIGDLEQIPLSAQAQLGCNQVFYNLTHREAEWAVSDWCHQRSVPLMAYSPLDQGGAMLKSSVLKSIAQRHQASAAQIALAWLLHQPDTIIIPKSSSIERISENLASFEIQLTQEDMQALDKAFPAPSQACTLGMR
ncbi:MAG: aldo/keto reductase, partial [Pseudomonadota bacterium]